MDLVVASPSSTALPSEYIIESLFAGSCLSMTSYNPKLCSTPALASSLLLERCALQGLNFGPWSSLNLCTRCLPASLYMHSLHTLTEYRGTIHLAITCYTSWACFSTEQRERGKVKDSRQFSTEPCAAIAMVATDTRHYRKVTAEREKKKKQCTDRESNPSRSLGKAAFCH